MRLLLIAVVLLAVTLPEASAQAQPFFMNEKRGEVSALSRATALTVLVVGGVVIADVLSGGTLTAPLWAMLGMEVSNTAPYLRRALPAAAVGVIPVPPSPAAPALRAVSAIR